MSDIIGIVDDSGNLITSYAYDAWGKVLSVTGSNVELGNINPFRYRSYYYDSDIEMYYLQSRYYDPEVCRFINSDDVNYIGLAGTVGSYNAFAYCENNPVNGWDPWGTIPLDRVFGISSIVSSVLSALGTISLLAFRQTPWGKMFSMMIATTAIISTFYSYLSATNSAKKFYGKNNKNYKSLLKYNSALLIATVASVIVAEVLSVKYLIKFSSNIAFELIRIRTFTICGLVFSTTEMFTKKSLYYKSRVKK